MFKNLDAEQARRGLTNSAVAEKLGISRVSYESKKKSGKFYVYEVKSYVSFSNVSLTIFLKQKNSPKCGNTQDYQGYRRAYAGVPLTYVFFCSNRKESDV